MSAVPSATCCDVRGEGAVPAYALHRIEPSRIRQTHAQESDQQASMPVLVEASFFHSLKSGGRFVDEAGPPHPSLEQTLLYIPNL
jgi:hypothetical protein